MAEFYVNYSQGAKTHYEGSVKIEAESKEEAIRIAKSLSQEELEDRINYCEICIEATEANEDIVIEEEE